MPFGHALCCAVVCRAFAVISFVCVVLLCFGVSDGVLCRFVVLCVGVYYGVFVLCCVMMLCVVCCRCVVVLCCLVLFLCCVVLT